MKLLILIGLLLACASAIAKTAKELELKCKVTAKVSEVHSLSYSPGKPAHYRLSEVPSSIHFQGGLEILSQDQGCEVLTEKYKIYLGSLQFNGGISPASESQMNDALALKDQIVELTLKQNIGYQNNGYLPLFPTVHSETLSFEFNSGAISGSVALQFDVNWVYSLTKIENLTDIQKLALAEKTLPYALDGDFHGLFLQLEPQQVILKKSYALLIWKLFKQYSQKGATQYLEFNVGGYGAYTGAPLATKLNQISQISGMFSSAEIVQLLVEFPTWTLAGYSKEQCLNFSTTDLEKVLEAIQVKQPVLTDNELWLLQSPLEEISGKYLRSTCLNGKVSDYSKQLATELLKK